MHPTSQCQLFGHPGQTPSLSCTVKRQPLQLPSLRCLQPRRQPRQMCRQPWTPARPLQNKGGNPPLGNNLSKHSHRIATQKLSQAPYNRAGNNMLPFLSTPQLERVVPHIGPRQPSHAGLTNRAVCQQSFHNHPIHFRSHIPRQHFPHPLATPPPAPIALAERVCRCRRIHDPLGDHRSACARTGVLRSRGVPLEHAAARVYREAGARVTMHTRLAHLNLPAVQRIDERTIEVIANGLPPWHGSQLAIDTTLVSPLTSEAQPRRRGRRYAAAALHTARRTKERTYPELVASSRCRLVVLGIEVGGRWSTEATQFLRSLAQNKAQPAPAPLRHAMITSLLSRWSAIITHAAQHAKGPGADTAEKGARKKRNWLLLLNLKECILHVQTT